MPDTDTRAADTKAELREGWAKIEKLIDALGQEMARQVETVQSSRRAIAGFDKAGSLIADLSRTTAGYMRHRGLGHLLESDPGTPVTELSRKVSRRLGA